MYNCGICHAKGINVKPALKYTELRADGSIAREDKICQGCHRGFILQGYTPSADKHTIIAQQHKPPAQSVPTTAESTLLVETTPGAPVAKPVSPAERIEPVVLPKLTAPEDYKPKPLTVTVAVPKPKAQPVASGNTIKTGRAIGKSSALPSGNIQTGQISGSKPPVKPSVEKQKSVPEKKPKARLKIVDKSKSS